MYVDIFIVFVIYLLSCIAIFISFYVLWVLDDIKKELKKKNSIKPQYIPQQKVVKKNIIWK